MKPNHMPGGQLEQVKVMGSAVQLVMETIAPESSTPAVGSYDNESGPNQMSNTET